MGTKRLIIRVVRMRNYKYKVFILHLVLDKYWILSLLSPPCLVILLSMNIPYIWNSVHSLIILKYMFNEDEIDLKEYYTLI